MKPQPQPLRNRKDPRSPAEPLVHEGGRPGSGSGGELSSGRASVRTFPRLWRVKDAGGWRRGRAGRNPLRAGGPSGGASLQGATWAARGRASAQSRSHQPGQRRRALRHLKTAGAPEGQHSKTQVWQRKGAIPLP